LLASCSPVGPSVVPFRRFREELDDLGSTDPTIIAFGKATYSILARNLGDKHRIVPITHYAHYIGKERYREELSRNW